MWQSQLDWDKDLGLTHHKVYFAVVPMNMMSYMHSKINAKK